MEFDDYMAAVPEARRRRLEAIEARIVALFPGARRTMSYRLPTYKTAEGWISFANQKHYVSVYTCGTHHLAAFLAKHPEIKSGTGCLNFRDGDEIPLDDLESVIRSAMTGAGNPPKKR